LRRLFTTTVAFASEVLKYVDGKFFLRHINSLAPVEMKDNKYYLICLGGMTIIENGRICQ